MTDQIRRRSRAQAREFMNFTKSSKFQFKETHPPPGILGNLYDMHPRDVYVLSKLTQINYGIKAKCNVMVCESPCSCTVEW